MTRGIRPTFVARTVALLAFALLVSGCGGGWQRQVEQVTIEGFEPTSRPAAVLADGRYLIRGRWDEDERIRQVSQLLGEDEPTVVHERPIRLFLIDPESAELTALSDVPVSREIDTLLGHTEGPDDVLLVFVSPDEKSVRYELGFSGGAYEVPYETRVAPIPDR